MKPKAFAIVMISTILCLSSLFLGQAWEDPPAPAPANIKTIIRQNCGVSGCHSGKSPAAGHNFEPDKFVAAVVDAPSQEMHDLKIVDAATPEKSYLLAKIKGQPGE